MLNLSKRWIQKLISQPETGMGHQIVPVYLKDGRRLEKVVVVQSGAIAEISGKKDIPFKEEEEIDDIIVTHQKWDFKKVS